MRTGVERHVLRNTMFQWLAAAVVNVVIFAFFMWYHAVRGKPCSLFVANKCIAIASVFSMGISLSLGPISRFFAGAAGALPYRRTLGVFGAFLIPLHVVLSVIFFRAPWYRDHWMAVVFGVVALSLLLAIAVSSYPPAFKRLGKQVWLSLQRLVWAVWILLLGHLLLLGKAPGWVKWLRTFDKPLPPGAFTTSLFCTLVLLLKLLDVCCHRRRKAKDVPDREQA